MFKTTLAALCFGAAFMLASNSNVLAATTYSTTDSWDQTSTISTFGSSGGGTATYGQVIETTKFSTILNSFEFFVNTSGSAINLFAQVYAWDSTNNSATGNALFSSSLLSVKSNDLQKVHVGTGATALTKNSEYVLLFTTNGVVQNAASAVFGWVGNNTEFGIGAWNNNRGPNANTSTWDGPWINGSFAFNAVFNSASDNSISGAVQAVPGPEAGAGLGALALGSMVLYMKRRRKEDAAIA